MGTTETMMVMSGVAMGTRTMSGCGGVLAGLAVCGLARPAFAERKESTEPPEIATPRAV